MTAPRNNFYRFQGHAPECDPTSFVAPGALLIGRVKLGPRASVWFNAVLRGDVGGIEVGEGSNVQDLTMVHVEGEGELGPGTPERGVRIGRFTTVGHGCMIHSCEIADDCLIGMNATIMGGSVIGRGSIVAAGAVVLADTIVPPFSLVVGSPGRVRKSYPPDEIPRVIRLSAESYLDRVQAFKEGLQPVEG